MSQQNRRVQQNTAAFPLLTAHDILECLAALDIPAQMEDLTKPTAQSTQSIYGSLLEVLMGASINSIEGPKQALLGMMEYKVLSFRSMKRTQINLSRQEMYSDTLQFMMFFKHWCVANTPIH